VRAYELMVIIDPSLDDQAIGAIVDSGIQQIQSAGGQVAAVDRWGRRRLAYEINRKSEGYYAVLQVVGEYAALEGLDRSFHLADEVMRHKIIRLPDDEARRRGLLGDGPAADSGEQGGGDQSGDEQSE